VKILYVCHRFPYPPKRGGKIRPFNMIRHLSSSHEVTVASLARSDEEADEGQGIAPFCHSFHMAKVDNRAQAIRMVMRLPTLTPSSMGFFYSPDLARQIRALLSRNRFDLIFVHCSSVAQYVAHADTPKILDFGDMDSQKWLDYSRFKPVPLNLGYRLEGLKLRREEARLAARFDMCTATTRAEFDTLQGYGISTPADWFPNGVDSQYFSPSEDPYKPNTLCFVGRMDYYPNQDCMFNFCEHTWPLLRERDPKLELLIVGADPPAAVRQLGNIDGVSVTGSVPDVRPYVHSAAAMIAPLNIARGTQNKLLEAMAMGVPVVTSSKAAAGVDAVPGEHFLVADTPAEECDAISSILNDPSERDRLATAGRARMLSNHNWERSMQQLDSIISRCKDSASRRLPVHSSA
jgi:hypothetical protein